MSDVNVEIPVVVPEVVERPVYKKKHVYKEGSPGFNRARAELTLTQIKKEIAQSRNKKKMRQQFQDQNMLAK